MIVCCDIDDTISNMGHVLIEYINREYNTDYKYSDITHWGFFASLMDKGIDAFKFLEWDGFWKSVKIYPNAVKVLEAFVKTGHKVFLVTATDLYNPAIKTKFGQVLKHFDPSLISRYNIVIAQDKSIINGDILIDDKLETCQDWLKMGKIVCMPTKPWNTKFDANSNCNQLSIFDDEDGDNMNERWIGVLDSLNKRLGLNLKIN